jgi:ornithine cyclodeaminase/alanine dehydrogenase-like protein (mu-crystallin family)
MGELHHALEERLLDRGAVAAELSEVVAGTKPGRRTSDEIVVFDSTGVALEDVAAAAAVYERARAAGLGAAIDLSA